MKCRSRFRPENEKDTRQLSGDCGFIIPGHKRSRKAEVKPCAPQRKNWML
jgi:hypothetical protein